MPESSVQKIRNSTLPEPLFCRLRRVGFGLTPAVVWAAALAACSAPTSQVEQPILSQKEAELTAPGMIPGECESLLNKSKEWGFVPGQKWASQSPEQMLEVARFFATFPMVPEESSKRFLELRQKRVHLSEESDKELANRMREVQVCDPFLVQQFLFSVLDYSWPEEKRKEAAQAVHSFLLNQQARELPLFHRGVAAQVFAKALSRGFLPGKRGQAAGFSKWMESEIRKNQTKLAPEGAPDPEFVEGVRRELMLSNAIREKQAILMPLP